ncbi:related to 2-amino-3-carboxylmuconate-6-semialdehyde decarboxylase [Serendipita indica DSM 11827]|uniref:Related to 2-amino-3-carboxylmuconate-6-semialdehyde decarboxylase n=1 Tax=Serendipita indica (strain DSM 11827) TaxID=1109443 RepID=G4TA51_SERID|nr:related to 2-amino-3-carboxylmuconate-6-semialdehyde decarboxylase [Serendipita indica DSM 11827]
MSVRQLLVDIHTHCYLPRYAAFLRQRSFAPRIFTRNQEERLLILDDEPLSGRPVGPQYWDRDEKLKFMDLHNIDVSIVSTANPWLDFLDKPSTASQLANELNEDLENYCATSPGVDGFDTMKRLYGFGLLPLIKGIGTEDLLQTVKHITGLPHLKGIIMGTRGIGKGLDDPALEPLWEALSNTKLVVFLHPHYGLGSGAKEAWGDQENGHVLPLAIGFPVETTTAITRLILAGVYDRHPDLKILLAHSGGALPQLSSRIASCISHDPLVSSRLKHDARYYVSRLYYDAVNYGPEEMGFVADVIGRGTAYSSIPGAREDRLVGYKRMLFGTDHPFFPPLGKEAKWASVLENLQAIDEVQRWEKEHKNAVRGGNAIELFGLGHEQGK